MSAATTLAVELLVQCLESSSADSLYLANVPLAARPDVLHWLVKERLLVSGRRKEWVTCPECQEGQAHVRQAQGEESLLGECEHCGEVAIPSRLTDAYVLALSQVANYVRLGLRLNQTPILVKGTKAWSLGKTTNKRGAFHSWYFGCGLAEATTARALRDRVDKDKAGGSCTLITSTNLDQLERGPLANLHVVRLDSVARLGQSRFHFDWNRLEAVGTPEDTGSRPATTLRFLRDHGYVCVDGERQDLSPQEKAFLLALFDCEDHELGLHNLKKAVGSIAQHFKPNRVFDQHPTVYATFVQYDKVDGHYCLVVPPDDEGLML